MILIPFVLNLFILKQVKNINWKFLLLIMAIYLPFIAYGREFNPIVGFIDDMEVYYKIYMAQILDGGLRFSNSKLEYLIPIFFKLISPLGDIGIKNLYMILVALQVATLYFAIVEDKKSCLIFLVIIYSAPFIINSGVFVRQTLALCLFLICIKNDRVKSFKKYFISLIAIFTHVTTLILLLFDIFAIFLGKFKNKTKILWLMLMLLFMMMCFQPFTYDMFINLMSTFFPNQAGFFQLITAPPTRLSLTAFLFSTSAIIYGLTFKKVLDYKIITIYLMVMIGCFAFGTIPFLASRAGLLVIVFGPAIFLALNCSKLDVIMLCFYPLYTLIAFSMHGSLFMRSHFGKTLVLW